MKKTVLSILLKPEKLILFTLILMSFCGVSVARAEISLETLGISSELAQETIDSDAMEKGLVSLTFDDGTSDIYKAIFTDKLLGNFKSTQFIIPAGMDCNTLSGGEYCSDFMSQLEVKNLHDDGHEIAAHTRTDPLGGLVGLSPTELQFEVDGLRLDLIQKIGAIVNTFAYPFGVYDQAVINKLQSSGIVGARTVDFIDQFGQPILNVKTTNPYQLNAGQINLETPITRTDIQPGWNFGSVEDWIDQAIASKKWLILVFHKIDESCTGQGIPLPLEEGGGFDIYCTTPAKLSLIADYLASKSDKLEVVTLQEGLSYLNNRPIAGAGIPVIAQADITASTTSPAGAIIDFSPIVTDDDQNLSSPLKTFCTIDKPKYPITPENPYGGHPVWGVNYPTVVASGSLFPIGTTLVTCTAVDTGGNIGSKTFNVNVLDITDTVPPTITLNGANPMSLKVGETFLDPGATAVDNLDPTVTVVVGGDLVKTSIAGTYRITYNAVDQASNKAKEVVRVVNVMPSRFYIFTKVLKLGSWGTEVKELQKRLKIERVYFGLITGYFDLFTRSAVKSYQKKNNLPQTGILDLATMARLNSDK